MRSFVDNFDGAAWVRLLALVTVGLASGDTYDSVMAIDNPKKRRSIGIVVLASPLSVLFSLIFDTTYPYCMGSINGSVIGLYLAKGLASYLYCARAEVVLTATVQKVTKTNFAILKGMEIFAFLTIVFNCCKALFVYTNVVLPNGMCIPNLGGSLWGASDEILFMILDFATSVMLFSFYRQFQESSMASNTTGKSNVKRVLRRILRLSIISLMATIFSIIMQFQDPGQIKNAGTFDACISVVTLTLVFNKPQHKSSRASIASRKQSKRNSGTSTHTSVVRPE